MESTSYSFSENAAGKAASRMSNASASHDSVVLSKPDGQRSLEGHDDCVSCVSGTDEQVNKKSDIEVCGNKYDEQNKIDGEISGMVSPGSSQTEVSVTKNIDDAADTKKVRNISQSSNDKNLLQEESPVIANDEHSNKKVEVLKASIEHFNSSSSNRVASDNVCGDPPKTNLDSIENNDTMDVDTHRVDVSDDSDMGEQDVKVCDICGDAGQEDLLALCSRCSDGAEHTYCTREMLEKLPEGEWLCEECKTLELVGNRKQGKIGSMDESEKTNSCGQASEYLNHSDVEGHRTRSYTRIPSKRLQDDEDVEVSSVAKKPAPVSTVGSPKTSNYEVALLSHESSLRNLEKGRQSPNHSALDTVPVNEATELTKPAADAHGINLRGNFAKSNSFSSLNSKPKVKLVDQVVIQRQKSGKEHGPFHLKEGVLAKSVGKSMPFRSTSPIRSESKLKVLSPRLPHIQDVKNTKERSAFERQRSFRAERPSNNSIVGTSMNSTSRIDKRSSSAAESSSLIMPSIHHDVKQGQSDSKSATLSRSSSLAARRTADLPSSSGDFKRPSNHDPSTFVLSPANGVNNIEQKYNQTSLKRDPTPCPGVSVKVPVNACEGLSDGLVQSKDITDSADRPREYSGSCIQSSKDESDNLKAAIEAALLRKPGIYRKYRSLGQSEESSMPTLAPVASHIDRISSVRNRKLCSDSELTERPTVYQNFTAPLKEETNNSLKQSLLVSAEGLSSVGREVVSVDHFSRVAFSNVQAAIPLIPKHEYIWQGSFEVCRSGETFELWDGIQAHLSTCASATPKVVEAVNKIKNRITLYEVSRASTWPVQFQENGVREDNVALFFFAKDLQSYDKIYKVVLENMMKNDLALRGNINGVELLIFPSNQLPVNFQRWNMFFFLWGVFRGKTESNMQQMPEYVLSSQSISPPIMSLTENRFSLGPITENASQDLHPRLEVPASGDLRVSPSVVKRDVIYVSPSDHLGNGINSRSFSALQSDGEKQSGEVRSAYQEGNMSPSCSTPFAMTNPGTGGELRLLQLNIPLGNPHSPRASNKSATDMH